MAARYPGGHQCARPRLQPEGAGEARAPQGGASASRRRRHRGAPGAGPLRVRGCLLENARAQAGSAGGTAGGRAPHAHLLGRRTPPASGGGPERKLQPWGDTRRGVVHQSAGPRIRRRYLGLGRGWSIAEAEDSGRGAAQSERHLLTLPEREGTSTGGLVGRVVGVVGDFLLGGPIVGVSGTCVLVGLAVGRQYSTDPTQQAPKRVYS
jgi:hypothetical protein